MLNQSLNKPGATTGASSSASLRAGAHFVTPRVASRRSTTRIQSLFGFGGKKKKQAVASKTVEKKVTKPANNGATTTKASDITEDEVRALFSVWNNALATGDSGIVAKCYGPNAVLLPTVSDVPRTDYEGIKDYFDNFLKLKPQGVILEGKIRIGDGWAQDCGIYEFTMGATGAVVRARYSWVYTNETGDWKISHHHSSMMPEGIIGSTTAITKKEVRGLFDLWNDALATLDSDKVAQRYSKNAVLLPTVSDVPRTDYDSIKDYFDNFLTKKPQGVILEGEITIGDNWCQDAGIYEFTMGADGSKVKARYSWIYVFEDGEWKISHHHSSVMPEEVLPSAITEKEVRALFSVWNNALATGDSSIVAKCYGPNAVLLPTVSDVPRTDYDSIKDYFDNFLKLKPQGKILEGEIKIGSNWAQDCGIYEFTMGATGAVVRARYSWVYTNEGGDWKISHHHSSVMPEAIIGSSKEITEDEVRSLFNLWNDALATLNSDKVAQRYAKNACLLPTVSDVPRNDYDSIKDYFDNFLKKKPQGEILEGEVVIGDNWCQDAGIYEFTMGADGSKVKARYSWIYVFEDGEWKISHHHSSVMPEDILPTPITKDEVRALFNKWNDALATGDPKKVAACYTKDAVLLPTVSDTARNDPAAIEAYFVDFLKKKPQGVITEGEIKMGTNWAQDAGIYEFTMGVDGSKVMARYSWVYALEDGEWKISHHHSSIMPEGALSALGKVAELEKETVAA